MIKHKKWRCWAMYNLISGWHLHMSDIQYFEGIIQYLESLLTSVGVGLQSLTL